MLLTKFVFALQDHTPGGGVNPMFFNLSVVLGSLLSLSSRYGWGLCHCLSNCPFNLSLQLQVGAQALCAIAWALSPTKEVSTLAGFPPNRFFGPTNVPNKTILYPKSIHNYLVVVVVVVHTYKNNISNNNNNNNNNNFIIINNNSNKSNNSNFSN